MIMAAPETRSRAGIVLSLPTSAMLVALFFMPWLKLSCNASAVAEKAQLRNLPAMPAELAKAKELAQASGWQLARGQMTPIGPLKSCDKTIGPDAELPKTRPWVYVCLAVPVLLVLVSGLGAMSSLSISGVGKAMLLLGVAGFVAVLLVTTVEYADEIIEKALAQLPGGQRSSLSQQISEAKSKMRELLQTKATPYLWVSLGLYGLIAICSVATLKAPRTSARAAQFSWHADTVFRDEIIAAGPEIYQPGQQPSSQRGAPDRPPAPQQGPGQAAERPAQAHSVQNT